MQHYGGVFVNNGAVCRAGDGSHRRLFDQGRCYREGDLSGIPAKVSVSINREVDHVARIKLPEAIGIGIGHPSAAAGRLHIRQERLALVEYLETHLTAFVMHSPHTQFRNRVVSLQGCNECGYKKLLSSGGYIWKSRTPDGCGVLLS